jgi:hypothetical protein
LNEALWVGSEGCGERDLAGGVDVVGLTVMNLIGRHEAQADVVMGLVVTHGRIAWHPRYSQSTWGTSVDI